MDAHSSLWAGRRVLVTGCTGFLGSAVSRELLDRGAVVVGLVRDRAGGTEFTRERDAGRFRTVHGRAEDAIRLHTTLAVHEVTAVFHLAESDPSGRDRGTAAVLRAAGIHHPRTPVVVARPNGQLRLAGDAEPAPVPLGVARFGELFGPGDRKVFRVVPRAAIALVTGDPVAHADGPRRDFVFVRDAARACLKVAEAVGAGGEPLDAGFRSGWERTEREMAQFVADVGSGRTPAGSDGEPPANPLGWQPGMSCAAAVGETLAWYREFLRTRFFGTRGTDARKAA